MISASGIEEGTVASVLAARAAAHSDAQKSQQAFAAKSSV